MFSSLVESVCLYVKHWVLDHAHPPPFCGLTVYPGAKDSLHASITEYVISMIDLPWMVVTHSHLENEKRTCMWINGEEHRGCFAVCRYLGRFWKFMPTNPESALIVDSLLELLESFHQPLVCSNVVGVESLTKHLDFYVSELNATLIDGGYLGGMQTVSLADIMWYSSIRHMVTRYAMVDEFYDDEKYECFHAWWETMSTDGISMEESVEKKNA